MLSEVKLKNNRKLEDYKDIHSAMPAKIDAIMQKAERLKSKIGNRTLWHVNSTAVGGGVAEMLPTLCSLLNDVGIVTGWLVIGSDNPVFFDFTKRIHNYIHGAGDHDATIGRDDVDTYYKVNRENAAKMLNFVKDGDCLVVHDPQPAATGPIVKESRNVSLIWRSHIGIDKENHATKLAWDFLKPIVTAYDRVIFTHPAYVPSYLHDKNALITPAIDPLSPKNKFLNEEEIKTIFFKAGLVSGNGEKFGELAEVVGANGENCSNLNLPLLDKIYALEISRWDKLKGFLPLLRSFSKMKKNLGNGEYSRISMESQKWLAECNLVLAGPKEGAVSDDPESLEVFNSLVECYKNLSDDIKKKIFIIQLPMSSTQDNALICNALQRKAGLVIQNSLQEGFGLTVTEAMWKEVPMLVSSANGISLQVRNGLEGKVIKDPLDEEEIAKKLSVFIADRDERLKCSRASYIRVLENFINIAQAEKYLDLLNEIWE